MFDELMRKKFDNGINEAITEYNRVIEENKKLREENSYLKNKNYKDEELKSLNEKLITAQLESLHYGMKEPDYKEMTQWWNDHLNKKHKKELEDYQKIKTLTKKSSIILPNNHYEIHESCVGVCYSIKCSCGEYHDIFY